MVYRCGYCGKRYTMKYIKIVVKGKCVLNSIDMIEYKHPSVKYQVNLPADEKISKINMELLFNVPF